MLRSYRHRIRMSKETSYIFPVSLYHFIYASPLSPLDAIGPVLQNDIKGPMGGFIVTFHKGGWGETLRGLRAPSKRDTISRSLGAVYKSSREQKLL